MNASENPARTEEVARIRLGDTAVVVRLGGLERTVIKVWNVKTKPCTRIISNWFLWVQLYVNCNTMNRQLATA